MLTAILVEARSQLLLKKSLRFLQISSEVRSLAKRKLQDRRRRRPDAPGLHQALHPLPARNEWGEDRRGETNKNAPPLPSPLLHPMEEREELDAALWPIGMAQPLLDG